MKQRGFSLVELMVAMTLSLLLLAGALSILYSSRVTYNENDRLARLQEAGRTVIELILRDARPAGFQGCSRPLNGDEFSTGLLNSNLVLWNFLQPVFGHESTAGAMSAELTALLPDGDANSDVLVVRSTRQGQPVFRLNSPVTDTTATIKVDSQAGSAVAANTPMIIADCEGASVFMATGYTPPSGISPGEIAHAIGGAEGNATAEISRGFSMGAQVMPVQTIAYYVRPSEFGTRNSLWQRVGTADPVELIEGVQNLQVRYGVDTDNNLQADAYQTADVISAANDWPRVISIEFAVLIESPDETGTVADGRTYDLLGTNVGPFNDRRQRAVFTTTVVMRNRTF